MTDTATAARCQSRFLDPENQQILHCRVSHALPDPDLHATSPFTWSATGAIPAEQPCDKRCARCVERARGELIRTALRLHDDWTQDVEFHAAVLGYKQVMGL